jgi:hypothetical protein
VFGRSKTWLSTVFVDVTTFLAAEFGEILRWHPQLTPRRVNAFADAVQQTGGIQADGLGIWGFVDGHFVGFARPQGVERQRAFYSGHKEAHRMNFQAIGTPDGLVSSLIGPFPGPVNDWAMWKCSGCDERLRSLQQQAGDSRRFYIYSDYAYRLVFGVMSPMAHARGRRYLSNDKKRFNATLASCRIAVENSFGYVYQNWAYHSFTKGLRSGD